VDSVNGTVLVASDGSDESLVAVHWSASLARRLGWRQRIVDLAERPSIEMRPEDESAFGSEAREQLRAHLAERGEALGDVEVHAGDPVAVLADLSGQADLLVLGSKPVEGVTKRGLLSIAAGLAHRSACPMVAVPAGDWPAPDETWVVGIDGSKGSLVTLHWAASTASSLGARVVGLYAADPIFDTFDSEGWYGREETKARKEAALEDVEFFERTGADPAAVLRAFADEVDASMIVVGAKFRGSLGGVLLGKVPEELLHQHTRPVAIVTHEYEERHLADLG
jgi:nucleotide-binding universal stress UspA family protein